MRSLQPAGCADFDGSFSDVYAKTISLVQNPPRILWLQHIIQGRMIKTMKLTLLDLSLKEVSIPMGLPERTMGVKEINSQNCGGKLWLKRSFLKTDNYEFFK